MNSLRRRLKQLEKEEDNEYRIECVHESSFEWRDANRAIDLAENTGMRWVPGHEACEAVQQMYGTPSDLCVRGDKVSFDPDTIPPSSDDYLNEIQRINKAAALLESKFGDKFVIKGASGYNKQFCQFRGGGEIFILIEPNLWQPLY